MYDCVTIDRQGFVCVQWYMTLIQVRCSFRLVRNSRRFLLTFAGGRAASDERRGIRNTFDYIFTQLTMLNLF